MVDVDERRCLSSEQIQEKELSILLAFDEICRSQGWRYSLAGGTLLGAVRHEGFIPWDDDIDVCMPRPDYEEFVRHGASLLANSDYSLEGYPKTGASRSLFSKMTMRSVVVEERYMAEHTHLWIDVFPVDGLPESLAETSRIFDRAARYRRLIMASVADPNEGKTKVRSAMKRVFQAVDPGGLMARRAECRLLALAETVPYGGTRFVGDIVWGLYGEGERVELSLFERFVQVDFEGYRFPAMGCWDAYLSGIYGDYMTPPPAEGRKHHEMRAWEVS